MTARVTGVAHAAPPAHTQERLWLTFRDNFAGHRAAERV